MEGGRHFQSLWGCLSTWAVSTPLLDVLTNLFWVSGGAQAWVTPAGDGIWTSWAPLGFWKPVPVGPYMVQGQKSQSPSLCFEPSSCAPGLPELGTGCNSDPL